MSAQAQNRELLDRLYGEEFRHAHLINRHAVDSDARTVELSFSSEAEVERWYGVEILDHSATVRMDRLRNQAPLLLNHDRGQQIGVIESAQIDGSDKRGRAAVRFSRSALGEEIFRDVEDGIRGLVSVGYRIHKVEVEERGKVEFVRVVDWEPFEISIVSIPADDSVGVGRNAAAIELAQATAKRIQKESNTCYTVSTAIRPQAIRLALPHHLKVRRVKL